MFAESGATIGSPRGYSKSLSGEAYSTTAGCNATSKAAIAAGTALRSTTPVIVRRESELGGDALEPRAIGTVAYEQRVQILPRLLLHEPQHAVEPVPLAHEADEAQHETAGEAEAALRGFPVRQTGEGHLVDAVRYDVDPLARHSGRLDVAGQHLGHRQHQIGSAPGMALGPLRQPRQGDAAVPTTFLVEWGVDLEQQRHAEAASCPDPGREIQVVSFVDHVRPEGEDGARDRR